MTTGQVYKAVIDRERAFGYEGEDVEAIPHVTDEIIERIKSAGEKDGAEVVITELGGTVGEYQNGIFFEATRILKLRHPKDVLQIHVTYLPYLKNIGELKSKPAQQSVQHLNAMGIQPDFVIARSELPIDQRRMERLSLFCNVSPEDIIGNPDLKSIYEVPLYLEEQKIGEKIIKKLGLIEKGNSKLKKWTELKEKREGANKELKIAMVGKYFVTGNYKLVDSYVSVVEALKQACWVQGYDPEFTWIDSTEFEKGGISLKDYDGIVVPQGWGSRGVEGKLKAVQYARENKIPYLGLCFGMQMASIEFARNVLKLNKANSTEVDPVTEFPIIHVMPDQAEYLAKKQYGGTIRLGSWPCLIKEGTLLESIYKKFGNNKDAPWNSDRGKTTAPANLTNVIYERHRHRYEFNNKYREDFEKAGFIISGTTPDGELVEAIELKDHPFFVGTQFHPEYIARPLTPHPIFLAFVNAAAK